MGMRIELLEKRPTEEALVRLSSEAAAIDAELRPLREALHRRLVRTYRSSLYEG